MVTLTCPRGHTFERDLNVDITISGSTEVPDVLAYCPTCKEINTPLLPPGDGRYVTLAGEIRRLSGRLARASADELLELEQLLRSVKNDKDVEAGAAALESLGVPTAERSMSLREQRIWKLITVLAAVLPTLIALKIGGQPVTVELCSRLMSAQVEGATTEISKVGRNELCPCGSGKKFKRCHGAPESARPAAHDP